MTDPHMVGFEKEELYRQALFICCEGNDKFKAKTLKAALKIVSPEFMEGLFESRFCIRNLKFIGYDNWERDVPPDDFDPFFVYGKIYESIDFNGGTYCIKGYDGRIGGNYFEVCEIP